MKIICTKTENKRFGLPVYIVECADCGYRYEGVHVVFKCKCRKETVC